MSTDYAQPSVKLVKSVDDPLWQPVLQQWIQRFDGWWQHDRGERRDPAWAITATALAKNPIGPDAHRTALYLAHLPFNRWHAVTVDGWMKWNPLEQSFVEFVHSSSPAAVVSFLAPDFEDVRIDETRRWLWSMWRIEYVRRAYPC